MIHVSSIIRIIVILIGLLEICTVNGLTHDQRIKALETALTSQQNQITYLTSELDYVTKRQVSDYDTLSGATSTLSNDLYYLTNRVSGNEEDIASMRTIVATIEASVGEAWTKIVHLEKVGKIWKANFKVVNKTFAELKRKFNG